MLFLIKSKKYPGGIRCLTSWNKTSKQACTKKKQCLIKQTFFMMNNQGMKFKTTLLTWLTIFGTKALQYFKTFVGMFRTVRKSFLLPFIYSIIQPVGITRVVVEVFQSFHVSRLGWEKCTRKTRKHNKKIYSKRCDNLRRVLRNFVKVWESYTTGARHESLQFKEFCGSVGTRKAQSE